MHAYIVRSLELQGLARVRASLNAFVRGSPPERGFHEPIHRPSSEVAGALGGGWEDAGDGEKDCGRKWPRNGEVVLEDVVLRYPSQDKTSKPALQVGKCVRACACVSTCVLVFGEGSGSCANSKEFVRDGSLSGASSVHVCAVWWRDEGMR